MREGRVRKLSPTDERAIAEFLHAGGRISRVRESVVVSEPELLDYLARCGFAAKYQAGDSSAYLCQRKPASTSKLVALANERRRMADLPPFALRLAIVGHRGVVSRTRS